MSDEAAWRPVVPTGREDALLDGFPGYLREAVFPWLKRHVDEEHSAVSSRFFVEFQNGSRTDIGFKSDTYLSWRDTVLPHLRTLDDPTFTNLVDYGLSTEYASSSTHRLEKVLSDGGSAWTVVRWNRNKWRLTKRVSDGVQQALKEVLSASDIASVKLQEAWVDAYGVNPRASVAFTHAVVAVETAALSVIPVSKSDATLADLFSILEADNPKWRLIFRDSPKAPSGKALATMLRTLWRGHESRHGRPDYADATLEEARAAVVLAATLVHWFTSGVVVEVGANQ